MARSISRASYKSDDVRKQSDARRVVRQRMVEALQKGEHCLGLRLDAGPHLQALVDDASADLLDAVFCAMLAAWAWQRRDANYGLPDFDLLEGWIVGA